MKLQMDVQVGQIEGGLGPGRFIEVQQSERGRAVGGDDLPGMQASVGPYQRIRGSPDQGPGHLLRRGTQGVALGCQFRDVFIVLQPEVHHPPHLRGFQLCRMERKAVEDALSGAALRPVQLRDPGARPFLPRAGERFVGDRSLPRTQIRQSRSRDGTENDDVLGSPGKDPGGREGAGVQQDVQLCAALGGYRGAAGPEDFNVSALRPDDRPVVGPILDEFPLLRFRPQGGQPRIVRRDEFEVRVTQACSPDAGPSGCQDLQYVASWGLIRPSPADLPDCAGIVVGGPGDGRGPVHVISSFRRNPFRGSSMDDNNEERMKGA